MPLSQISVMVPAIERTSPPEEVRLCKCHSVPMIRDGHEGKTKRQRWRCRIRLREMRNKPERRAKRLAEVAAYFQKRYNNDPLWRISRNLKRAQEKRLATIERQRQAIESERG